MTKKIYIISIIVFILDQITKSIISTYLNIYDSIKIIKDLLYIKYINNFGASWGILKNSRIFLIILSVIAIIILIRYTNSFKKTKLNTIGFGILFGGILGNLSDRIIKGYVIDFICVDLFNFPIFNIADICIVIGVIILIIGIIKGEDSSANSSKRKWRENRQISKK